MTHHPPFSLFLNAANRPSHQAARKPGKALLRLVMLVENWLETSRSRRALACLNQRQLADIGLNPAQADHESKKPFWQK